MRVGIFYFSKRDGKDRSPVHLGPVTFPPNVCYIRCEVVEAKDEEVALDEALPRHDEVVMNSHEL